MFKKTLGLIAILLLIVVGEGYWVVKSGAPQRFLSLFNQEISGLGDSLATDINATDTDMGGEEPSVSAVVATLGDAQGDVTVFRNDESLALAPFMALYVDDRIETGADGKAEIGWTGYGRTLVAPNSIVTITSAEQGTANDGLIAQIKLEAGRVWTRLDKVLTSGSSFEVQASNVVATVRGTSFGVGIDAQGAIGVQVAKSKVSVALDGGASVDVNELEQLNINPDDRVIAKPIQLSPKDLLNDQLYQEGNVEVPKEYMDAEWMALVEMVLSQIPADQMPPEFDRAGFMEYMNQVKSQIPPEVMQQLKQQLKADLIKNY